MLGVPSVTSNLTGFSNFMTSRVERPDHHGIYVCDRRFKSYDETISQMADVMWSFCRFNRRERIEV